MTNHASPRLGLNLIMCCSVALAGCAAETAEPAAQSAIAVELIKVIPSLVWPLFVIAVLVWKKRDIARLFRTLTKRVEAGAAIKLSGVIEVGSSTSGGTIVHNAPAGTFKQDESRRAERTKIHTDNHGMFVAHTLHPSPDEDQVYDILLYLVTNWGNFLEVKEVQYYFGKHWDHLVVTSRTRLNGFAVKVSAWGPFLCTVRIVFNDDSFSSQYRFVDFEAPAQKPLRAASEAKNAEPVRSEPQMSASGPPG